MLTPAFNVSSEKPVNSVEKENKASKTVKDIFQHWKECLNHKKAKLDEKRIATIRRALLCGYTPNQLCEAITGCSLTPYNMGNNAQGQRYDSLDLILRDADHIDKFIHNATSPPVPKKQDAQTQGNHAVASWLDGKATQIKVVTCPEDDNLEPIVSDKTKH